MIETLKVTDEAEAASRRKLDAESFVAAVASRDRKA